MELIEPKTTTQAPRAVKQRSPHALSRALTETSWLPGEEIDLSDWVEHGRRLGVIGRCVGWWIGDWLRYGNMKFGERYARASRITGYDPQTLMNMVYVASAYDVSQRRSNLSFSHHAELAAIPAEEREGWLDMAEEKRLSVRCLRQELRQARRLKAAGESTEALPSTLSSGAPAEDEACVRCPQCGAELDEPALVALPRGGAHERVAERGAA